MATKSKNTLVLLIVGLLGLVWHGAGFVARAQTNAAAVQTDFERELQRLKGEVQGDPMAQQLGSEIDSEDSKNAGDDFGDNVVIDGEKSDAEIEKEINDEVNIENPDSEVKNNQPEGMDNTSTSTLQDNTPSFDANGDVQGGGADGSSGSDSGN